MSASNFPTLLTHLTTATAAAWPDTHTSPYRRVKVLLMIWDAAVAEPNLDREVHDLETVFHGLYGYETERWMIPARRSAVEVSRKVADVVDGYGKVGDLVVVYYGGWARGGVWAASPKYDAPTVSSSILHSFLSETDCDVLLLQDCPAPNSDSNPLNGTGIVESLSASSLGGTHPHKGSFTAAITQSLAHAAHNSDWLTGVDLHREIFTRLTLPSSSPTLSLTNDSYSLVQLDHRTGQPLDSQSVGQSSVPVYTVVGQKSKTLVLMPQNTQSTQGPTFSRIQDTPLIQLTPPSDPSPPTSTNGPDVLATCHLQDSHIDVNSWRSWLNDTHNEGSITQENHRNKIQLSALFPSPSGAVLLMRLPLAVWDMLQRTGAVSFVGYVTGEDHISVAVAARARVLGGSRLGMYLVS